MSALDVTDRRRRSERPLLPWDVVEALRAPDQGVDAPAAAVAKRPFAALRAWVVAHRLSIAIVSVLSVGTAIVQAIGLAGWPARYDDEGTYVAQAWAVSHLGTLGHYTFWYDHPPLGWLTLAALQWPANALTHTGNAIATGRLAMLPVGAVSSALVYALGRRLGFRRSFAALALLVFALNPLALNYHRMVWLDNVAVPWLLAAFVLALNPQRRLWATGASGICFALAVLTKETFLLLLPALLVAVWQGTDRSTRRYALTVFFVGLALVVAFYPLLALVKGELLPGAGHVSLFNGLRFQLSGRMASGSVFQAGTLSNKYVSGWMFLDPLLPAAALALTLPALASRRLRPVAVALAIGFLGLLRPGYLPAPYLIAMLPFAALIVAGALDTLWGRSPDSRRVLRVVRPLLAVAALTGAIAVAVPAWARGDHKEMTYNADVSVQQAERWIYSHVDAPSHLLVDDTFWLDLVQHRFAPSRVVWYYKLGTDSQVDARYPTGWRGFDYVISSDVLRSGSTSQTRAALAHSSVVAQWGSGSRRIEVRRIVR